MLHRMYLGQNKVTKPACAVHVIGMDQSIEQLPSTAHYIFYLSAPLIWCHHCTVTRYILGNEYNNFESSCIYYLWFSARRQICLKVSSPTGYATVQKIAYRELDILCGKLGGYVWPCQWHLHIPPKFCTHYHHPHYPELGQQFTHITHQRSKNCWQALCMCKGEWSSHLSETRS